MTGLEASGGIRRLQIVHSHRGCLKIAGRGRRFMATFTGEEEEIAGQIKGNA